MEKGFLSWLGSRTDWTEFTWRKVSSAGSVAEQTGLSLHGERFPQLGSVAEQTGLSLHGERFPQLGSVAEQTGLS